MAAVASPIQLRSSHLGLFKAAEIAPGALEECNALLEKNHEAYHIFYRDPAFHNHTVHSLLTTLTLGATTSELHDRFNELIAIQRPIPEIDEQLLTKLRDDDVFYETIGQINQYHTFLEYFKQQIGARGYRSVVLTYLFARTKVANRMLVQMVEGAYHPIIHLGFGIEFDQPAIVAEALAQAASHDRMNIEDVLFAAEKKATARYDSNASGDKPESLIDLVHSVRANERLRTAPVWSDLGAKMKAGVVGRAGADMADIAAKFTIKAHEADLERRTAEMVSVCAYMAGSAHTSGRPRKIDFFIMHSVTSSIFCTVIIRQDWIPLVDRVRIVEFKARTDLMWYAAIGSPTLDSQAISGYANAESDSLGWEDLFRDVRRESDDGHAAKFIRALKNGEDTAKRYEDTAEWSTYFPCKRDMWLKMAKLCQDTTKSRPWELKWVFFAGFEEGWKRPDLADPLNRIDKPMYGF
ncbi:hypothetical protein F5Y19DRAFT_480100 [Xylariaceae sp. FL1651]|nr:hypothetical protein F5Y19DRAFT_480100 [Xylariaceae sp. FL1651]